MASTKAPPSFLTKLSTLREFVTGMGVKASEDELSDQLKNSGHNVELALERILTGSFGGGGGGSSAAASSSASSSSLKKRGSSLLSSSSAAKTPKSSIKRQKQSGSNVGGRKSWSGAGAGSAPKCTPHQQNQQPTQRLLLCKRWTVACSKSVRGRVSYGEALDFSENWRTIVHKSHTPQKGSNAKNNKPVDPMVRFRSKSGSAEGTLNRYLCSVLSPLLRVPASGSSDNKFIPLVSIEGEALMEDTSLVIGSDVPVNLKIYLNDPIAFFELFQNDNSAGEDTSSKLFFRKKAASQGGSGKLPSYQTKKAKSSFTDGELAEAAFHLLQWAEKGEEMPFRKESADGKSEGETGVVGKSGFSSKGKGDDDSVTGDGDYEEDALESDEIDGLNELVVSGDEGKAKRALPELSDPDGFKAGVVLRPYQRQALHFLCRKEGCHIEGEMSNEDSDEGDGELDLLAELASSTHSNADASMQVWGGKAVACDCGPVAVSDESVASKALPVIEHGRKQNCKGTGRKYIHHPLWKRRFLATDDLGTVFAFFVNELLGIASATPPNPPRQCVGGILADAMGLGKTVMLLSLILKTKEAESGRSTTSEQLSSGAPTKLDRTSKRKRDAAPKKDAVELLSDDEDESDSPMDDDESWTDEQSPTMAKKPSAKGRKLSRATLVIAPLSLVSQWEEELASKTDLSHHVYYDAGKKAKGSDAFSCVDVVVTTYGTIQSEYVSLCKMSGGALEPGHAHPILAFDWKRIILDEAHGIKNPATVASKACCMLKADARWCVTGTPVQNSLQDVYGLLKFLRHEPWCESVFWKNAITNTASGASAGAGNASDTNDEKEAAQLAASAAFARVRRVLAPIILRRTKDTLSEDGTPILTLPPIDSSVVHVTLSPAEREFYNALLERSQSVFEGFLNAGTASKSWFAIFSLLQRLRQSCDHVALTVNKKLDTSELAQMKDSRGLAKKESFSSDDVEDGVDDTFLSGLLSKFRRKKTTNAQEEPTSFVKQVAETLSQCVQSSEEYMKNECPICLDEPRVEDAVHTPCGHMFCRGCLLSEFKEQQNRGNKKTVEVAMFKSSGPVQRKVEGGSCPVCHEWVKVSRVIGIEKSENGEARSTFLQQSPDKAEKENTPNVNNEALERDAAARATLESALSGANSSKLEAVLAELDRVWTSDPGSKVLVFSQYLGFLDITGRALADIGVECFRIDGKMSLKERVAMIAKFNKKRSRTSAMEEGVCQRGSVFLVSMKAGGVGLNLVAASSVFVLDPWWNQAIEDQCINRIHRIGQQAKVVRVRKFVVSDSVEEKIVALQGKKKGMANEILSDTDGGGGQLDSAKPTLEDFKLLFGR